MGFDFIIECFYANGERKFTYSSKYMRTRAGRPVKVIVRGPVTASDVHAIRNSALNADITYTDIEVPL